jgi:TonB family protein
MALAEPFGPSEFMHRVDVFTTSRLIAVTLSIVVAGAASRIDAQTPATTAQETASALATQRQTALNLMRAGKVNEALKILEADSKTNKNDPEVWRMLGLGYLEQSNYKKAIKSFQRSLEINSNQPGSHVGLAYVFFFTSQLVNAEKEISAALTLDPRHFDANYLSGLIKLRNGESDEALRHSELLVGQNPKFADAYLLRSQAVLHSVRNLKREDQDLRIARFAEAIVSLEKYLSLEPAGSQTEFWKTQMEALKLHSAVYSGTDKSIFALLPPEATKARLISKPEPSYTDEAKWRYVEGTVVLRAVFASDGTVKHVIVIQGLPSGLTRRAIEAAKLIKFTPASLNGQPLSMFMQLEYNFNLY